MALPEAQQRAGPPAPSALTTHINSRVPVQVRSPSPSLSSEQEHQKLQKQQEQQKQSSSQEQQQHHPAHLHALAQQVAHDLAHQHGWRSVEVHSQRPSGSASALDEETHAHAGTTSTGGGADLLPRPLVAGTPPRRVYTHPDEQLALIKAGLREADVRAERMWVVPARVGEAWSLRAFAGVFDALPPGGPGLGEGQEEAVGKGNGWEWEGRGKEVKRVLLAAVDDDSTVVYYVLHDGIVKPRQN